MGTNLSETTAVLDLIGWESKCASNSIFLSQTTNLGVEISSNKHNTCNFCTFSCCPFWWVAEKPRCCVAIECIFLSSRINQKWLCNHRKTRLTDFHWYSVLNRGLSKLKRSRSHDYIYRSTWWAIKQLTERFYLSSWFTSHVGDEYTGKTAREGLSGRSLNRCCSHETKEVSELASTCSGFHPARYFLLEFAAIFLHKLRCLTTEVSRTAR